MGKLTSLNKADLTHFTEEELKRTEEDCNLQLLVVLNIACEIIEFLEKRGFLFGKVKNHLVRSKTHVSDFISKIFKIESNFEGENSKQAAGKLLVLQQRVELALENKYIITSEERRERAKKILEENFKRNYKITFGNVKEEVLNLQTSLFVNQIMEEMEHKNLFNFQ